MGRSWEMEEDQIEKEEPRAASRNAGKDMHVCVCGGGVSNAPSPQGLKVNPGGMSSDSTAS